MPILDHLEPRAVFSCFEQLCAIPHGSGNTKAISDYLVRFAAEHQLRCIQDAHNNVIIFAPGTPGYESAAPVILQGHMDMVCEKNSDVEFDFDNDPIRTRIDGEWVRAEGTTLGADCGIGVALILAMLEADDYSHPPIEAILTTREETGMGGAYHLDFTKLSGRRMINLDVSPDQKLLAGSCGGAAIELDLPIARVADEPDDECFRITVSGLKGGHSGADIAKGRNNALLLLGRLLRTLAAEFKDLGLVDMQSGNSRLAIPREATMLVRLPEGMSRPLQDSMKAFEQSVALECSSIPDLCLNCTAVERQERRSLARASLDRLCDLLCLVPNGIYAMNALPLGTVESSCNLGILQLLENQAHLVTEMRGSYRSTRQCIIDQYETLARLLGGTISMHSSYHSWLYQPDSSLRERVLEVYRQREQKEMNVEVAHAGNEIGIFYEAIEGLDAVAMGPTRLEYHSPKERLSISSSIRFEEFLKQVLEQLQ